MNDLLVIAVRGAQRVFLGMRGADTAHDQTIYAKPINNLVQCTLEKEGGVFDEHAVHFRCRESGQREQTRLRVVAAPGAAARLVSTSCVGRG